MERAGKIKFRPDAVLKPGHNPAKSMTDQAEILAAEDKKPEETVIIFRHDGQPIAFKKKNDGTMVPANSPYAPTPTPSAAPRSAA
jgi:hypothetical protein